MRGSREPLGSPLDVAFAIALESKIDCKPQPVRAAAKDAAACYGSQGVVGDTHRELLMSRTSKILGKSRVCPRTVGPQSTLAWMLLFSVANGPIVATRNIEGTFKELERFDPTTGNARDVRALERDVD